LEAYEALLPAKRGGKIASNSPAAATPPTQTDRLRRRRRFAGAA
jgi:hypothetical protein